VLFSAQEAALEKVITIRFELQWEIISSLFCVCVSGLLATVDHFTTVRNEVGNHLNVTKSAVLIRILKLSRLK
jgi:hypothetical protein